MRLTTSPVHHRLASEAVLQGAGRFVTKTGTTPVMTLVNEPFFRPIEKPKGLIKNLVYAMMRRQFGKSSLWDIRSYCRCIDFHQIALSLLYQPSEHKGRLVPTILSNTKQNGGVVLPAILGGKYGCCERPEPCHTGPEAMVALLTCQSEYRGSLVPQIVNRVRCQVNSL